MKISNEHVTILAMEALQNRLKSDAQLHGGRNIATIEQMMDELASRIPADYRFRSMTTPSQAVEGKGSTEGVETRR